MLLHTLRLVVLCTIEDQIAWLQLMKLSLNRQRVKLVALVAPSKFEAKFILQVFDGARDQRTAVKEERSVIVRVIRLQVPLGVWYSNVLFALLYKPLPKPLFIHRIAIASPELLTGQTVAEFRPGQSQGFLLGRLVLD